MVGFAAWVDPVIVMHVVGPKLGLKGKSVTGTILGALLGICIFEPVSRIEMGAGCGDRYVKDASAFEVLGMKRRARGRIRAVIVDAEAMIVSTCLAELVAVLLDIATERLWLAEIKGCSCDVFHRSQGYVIVAKG